MTCALCSNEVETRSDYCNACRYQRSLERNRAWKARNRSVLNAKTRAHYAANKARYKKWREDWRARNHDAIKDYRRKLYVDQQRDTNTATVTEYRKRNPGKHAEIENRRRARLLAAFVEPIDPAEIRARDNERCGICGKHVPVKEQSIDHVIPLARGGMHERSNVQLAHRRCNSRKGTKLIRKRERVAA